MKTSNKPEALKPRVYMPLPLGSIKPLGWLKDQLRVQADGLSGHLDEFWIELKDSMWIGGDVEGWERGPYWLDGVVPLAFLLDDTSLKTKAEKWMNYILDHQLDDGWLGPVQDPQFEDNPYDPWPLFVFLKALIQYQEVRDDGRIVPAITRFFRKLDTLLDEAPLRSWGYYRWADLILSIHWLWERTREDWLLELAQKVHDQGFSWQSYFRNFPYKQRTDKVEAGHETHVVNNAMAIKQPGVWHRQSGDKTDEAGSALAMANLDRYHGQVTGVFTGDEHLAGKNPSQGTELCSVVEYMFSLEVLLAIFGEPHCADRLEKIAFNALPATFKPDMWARQYDQQVNQVICVEAEDRIYTTNDGDSNIFSLDRNCGCCTANMNQAWPKFTTHLWMKTQDEGLAAVAYAPCEVRTDIGGKPVRIELQTDYPFEEHLRITVHADAKFPLYLRIPAWADRAQLAVGGEASLHPDPGTFYRLERNWTGTTAVVLTLPMKTQLQRRYNRSVAITRGPLVYSLKVGERWRKVSGEEPHADWEVLPTSPWNYALYIEENEPDLSVRFTGGPVEGPPFSPETAPVSAKVEGRIVPEWKIEHNAAGPLPLSPVESTEPVEELELIPYGCTNLRVTEFPVLREKNE